MSEKLRPSNRTRLFGFGILLASLTQVGCTQEEKPVVDVGTKGGMPGSVAPPPPSTKVQIQTRDGKPK